MKIVFHYHASPAGRSACCRKMKSESYSA